MMGRVMGNCDGKNRKSGKKREGNFPDQECRPEGNFPDHFLPTRANSPSTKNADQSEFPPRPFVPLWEVFTFHPEE